MTIAVRGVAKYWSEHARLDPTDLEVEAGHVVVVRGRSGTGKSTLLAIIAGFCRPDRGTVTIGGRPPTRNEPWTRIAFVPQALCLAPELTVFENIADVNPTIASSDIIAAMDSADIANLASRTLAEISTGQQQRAAIARAVAARPTALLADEPTSFQDAEHVSTVLSALRALATTGSAVLIATHDDAVANAADRVVELT